MKSTGNEVAIMKDLRLHEGELNVMELLWSNKALAARIYWLGEKYNLYSDQTFDRKRCDHQRRSWLYMSSKRI